MAELQAKLGELEDLNTELADRLEEHMSIQQNEKTEREAELLANNEEIQAVSGERQACLVVRRTENWRPRSWTVSSTQLAARVQELEDELEGRVAKERDLERELDAQDAQIEDTHSLHDQVIAALKEVRQPVKWLRESRRRRDWPLHRPICRP
jgi:chromosome segregation ATPase